MEGCAQILVVHRPIPSPPISAPLEFRRESDSELAAACFSVGSKGERVLREPIERVPLSGVWGKAPRNGAGEETRSVKRRFDKILN